KRRRIPICSALSPGRRRARRPNSFTEPADRFVGAKSRLAAMISFLTLGGVPLAAHATAPGAAAIAKGSKEFLRLQLETADMRVFRTRPLFPTAWVPDETTPPKRPF